MTTSSRTGWVRPPRVRSLAELPCPPLYGTAPSPERETLGGAVGEAAARLGKPLMPHQQYIADVAMEIDPETGLRAYSEIVIIGPRQVTGKTELILPVMTHRCTGFAERGGPQRVLYTAQTVDAADAKWRDVHLPRLLASPTIAKRFTTRRTNSREAFLWVNGSIWCPGSTTGKSAGTGDTLDLGVIDEAWSRPDDKTQLGMKPAMATRDWSQLWILSMIPGISRALPGSWPFLAHKRQVGRARVDADVRRGMAIFDFSAAPDLDPGDPNTWYSCMPGLGRTTREEAILDMYDGLDIVDFCAEFLGWAPDTVRKARWTLVDRQMWQTVLFDPSSTIVDRPALAVEISEDRTRAHIGAAGRRFDGHWHLEVVEPGGLISPVTADVTWTEPRLLELIEAHKPVTVVIDPRRPANSLIAPLKQRRIDVTTPNQNEIAGACGRFVDRCSSMVVEGAPVEQVRHLGQPELDDALAHARTLDMGGGAFTIVKKGVADLGALYSVILAMHGHEVKPQDQLPEPEIYF